MPPKASVTARAAKQAKVSVEDAALERVIAYLHGRDHRVELRRRPDRLARDAPAVDGELVVDGEIVAVEVTRLTRAPREHLETAAFEQALQGPLTSLASELSLELVAISVEYRRFPKRREIATALAVVRNELNDAMRRLPPATHGRSQIQIPTSVSFISSLEVIHLPSTKPRVAWVSGSSEWGGWVDPMADDFVEHLLDTKPRQTQGYREAWILVVDWVTLVDADNLREALRRRLADVPMNWTKVFFLAAADEGAVEEIAMAPMRAEIAASSA